MQQIMMKPLLSVCVQPEATNPSIIFIRNDCDYVIRIKNITPFYLNNVPNYFFFFSAGAIKDF